jgi:hypothetical protein
MTFSSEFLPLYRNGFAPGIHQRAPHDPRQIRLHHVNAYNYGSGFLTETLDPIAFDRTLAELPSSYLTIQMIYDTKLKRANYKKGSFDEKEQKKMAAKIAQLRFEDGQYAGYSKDEWESLKTWISKQKDPQELENYFVNEILKYRPQDRERYKYSPLADLFKSMNQSC